MANHFKHWRNTNISERGQDLAEYALFLGLIALVVIVAVTLMGEQISTVFSSLAANVQAWPSTYGW